MDAEGYRRKVRPPAPRRAFRYLLKEMPLDIAIIGAGPGGYVAAIRAAQLGLSVTVIDRDSRFGGTCTLRGCIPTKALLRDAHLFQEVRKAVQQGLFKAGDWQFDFSRIQARK